VRYSNGDEREDVADIWKGRLAANYSRQRFPLLLAFIRFLRFLAGPLYKVWHTKLLKRHLQNGWISRAEFEDRIGRIKPAK